MSAIRSPEDLLTSNEAAVEEIDCAPSTLPKWRQLGKGPKYIKQGRWLRYRRGDIWDWQASLTVTPGEGVRP